MSLLTLFQLNLQAGVLGSGILLDGAADITGAGTVSGAGTSATGRRHKTKLQYEPVIHGR